MQGRAASLAAILVLLTAFSVSRLQAQNQETSVEQLLAELKVVTTRMDRLAAEVAALNARVGALEEGGAPDPLAGIAIADEERCTPYDADDYPYAQSVEAKIVAAMGGRIYGPYSGTTFASTSETDIEHIVARSEAHDSGLCAADAATRAAFASDLLNLTLAAPDLNRNKKRDKDLAEWLPERNRCWYVAQVAAVKRKYVLTMDEGEMRAALSVLAFCVSSEMVFHSGPPTAPPTAPTPVPTPTEDSSTAPSPTPAPQAVDALALYDDNGNGRITCAEARAHGIAPVERGHPAYQYMRDADGDGVVCEG